MNTQEGRLLELHFYDCIEYSQALRWQEALVKERQREERGDCLLLLEHPPVYTMGRRDSSEDLLCSQTDLPAPLHRISRGGEVTFHGPGQLIGYLIARLSCFPFSLRELIDRLEKSLIEFLAIYGVSGSQDSEHRGVWVAGSKIAALGLAVHRGVTMHGFALNLWNDLAFYESIIPCGIRHRGVTSLSQLIAKESLPKMLQAKEEMASICQRQLLYQEKIMMRKECLV